MNGPGAIQTPRWIKPLARIGYGARGVVYSIIAFFALVAAFGGGRKEGTKGAIAAITENRAGDILTFALLAGLAGYVAWRLVQAILDADHHGKSWKGLAARFGLLLSGGTYAVLAVYTLSLWWGSRSSADSDHGGFADTVTAFVGARATAFALAAVFAVIGAVHFWRAFKQTFERYLHPPEAARHVVYGLATGGLAARGVIFLIIGVLLVTRGINAGEGGKPPDLSDALEFLQGLPFGSLLLALAGLGLLAFALYSFSDSIWRRIGPS